MTTIHLIRHAESQGNVNHHLIGGQSNHFPLTKRGEAQARKLGERLLREGYQFDRVYASPAVRARETARLACSFLGMDITTIAYTPQLLELSQGEWEGLDRKEIYTAERRKELRADPLHFRAPGGESQDEVANRMEAWLKEAIAAGEPEADQTIAAFTHGFAIKTLFARVLQASPSATHNIITHNTSITTLQLRRSRWLFERLNDYQHLHGTEFIDHYG